MKLSVPFVSKRAHVEALESLHAKNVALQRINADLSTELISVKNSALGEANDSAKKMLLLSERLGAAQALAADKQREIATLRKDVEYRDQMIERERAVSREEREGLMCRVEKLMDWITKGISGVPIFSEPPVEVAEESPRPETDEERAKRLMKEEVTETPVTKAIREAGTRNARHVVKTITRNNERTFAEEMSSAGVRRTFDKDREDAEREALEVTAESQRA